MSVRVRLLALAGVTLVCAGWAASLVSSKERRLQEQVGSLTPVLVAKRDVQPDREIESGDLASLFALRRVPARFVPPTALRDPGDVAGQRFAFALAAGDYVTSSALSPDGNEQAGEGGARGRLVQVAVSGASVLSEVDEGTTVDVIVTTEREGRARSYLALQRAQLVAVGAAADQPSDARQTADGVATLRVSLRAAILLTAAQNFAREVRLVPRLPGDRRVLSGMTVAAGDLRP